MKIGINLKCDKSEESILNPRVSQLEEVKQELEKVLSLDFQDDSDHIDLLNEFSENYATTQTYEATQEMIDESDSSSNSSYSQRETEVEATNNNHSEIDEDSELEIQ